MLMAYNVLIVDDSKIVRALVRRILGLAELPIDQIFEAGNGIEALERLKMEKIHLVLADLHMPEMGGVQMTEIMLADGRLQKIPVVIISAEPDTDKLEALKARGVRAYVRKPFKPEQIRNVIEEVMSLKKSDESQPSDETTK